MPNRAELETQLAHEIHYLPIEAVESMLKLALLMKKQILLKFRNKPIILWISLEAPR
jgi:hypothetical protein